MAIEHASQFISAIFDPDDLVEIRVLGPTNSQNWHRAKHITPKVLEDIRSRSDAGKRNVYVGANPRKGKTGNADGVALARCLFVDFDGVTLDEAKKRIAPLPKPTITVQSGHGVHFWWRLAEPIKDLGLWTGVQKALIEALGSDKAIHDPPRIMRLPGFCNYKSEPVECVVLDSTGSVWNISDFPAAIEPPKPVVADRPSNGEKLRLRNVVMETLSVGAKKGERNDRLFQAACDLYGAGYEDAEIREKVGTANARSEPPLPDAELKALIDSALSKERTPYVCEEDEGEIGDWDRPTNDDGPKPETKPSPKKTTEKPPVIPSRHLVSNAVVVGTGEERKLLVKPIDHIVKGLHEATGEWPRRVSGLCFVPGNYDKEALPTSEAIRAINRPDELFAWIHENCEIHWVPSSRAKTQRRGDGSARTVVTKGELFESIRQTVKPHYAAVEFLPHEPHCPETFYVPFELPASTGKALEELVDHLNPATDLDRKLMICALMTPGWGGPCGARPAFIFSARLPGAGKSKTAELFARVWGGYIPLSQNIKKGWERFSQAIVSDSGLSKRVVIIGNVTFKLSSSDLEDMITTNTITGHRLFHGSFSRPNRISLYITANTPTLGHDLAERAVELRFGNPKPTEASDFESWLERFLGDHRMALLSDLVASLSPNKERKGRIERANSDRWGAWQRDILCLFEDADELAALIKSRRLDVDQDAIDAADLKSEIAAGLMGIGQNPENGLVTITVSQMAEILWKRGICQAKTVVAATTWLKRAASINQELNSWLEYDNRWGIGRCWTCGPRITT